MKIRELLKLIKQTDLENDVYIESINGYMTSNIGANFDDNNDLSLFEVREGD